MLRPCVADLGELYCGNVETQRRFKLQSCVSSKQHLQITSNGCRLPTLTAFNLIHPIPYFFNHRLSLYSLALLCSWILSWRPFIIILFALSFHRHSHLSTLLPLSIRNYLFNNWIPSPFFTNPSSHIIIIIIIIIHGYRQWYMYLFINLYRNFHESIMRASLRFSLCHWIDVL